MSKKRNFEYEEEEREQQDESANKSLLTEETQTIKRQKEKPNFKNSGLLVKQDRIQNGVELKYQPPPEARIPPVDSCKWRLYVFKEDDSKEPKEEYSLEKQSCYLFGREQKVVDIVLKHPSTSKQHAVIQFRQVEDAKKGKSVVKPYLMDLDSTNGTMINKHKISAKRFYEILNTDIINFGTGKDDFVFIKEEP